MQLEKLKKKSIMLLFYIIMSQTESSIKHIQDEFPKHCRVIENCWNACVEGNLNKLISLAYDDLLWDDVHFMPDFVARALHLQMLSMEQLGIMEFSIHIHSYFYCRNYYVNFASDYFYALATGRDELIELYHSPMGTYGKPKYNFPFLCGRSDVIELSEETVEANNLFNHWFDDKEQANEAKEISRNSFRHMTEFDCQVVSDLSEVEYEVGFNRIHFIRFVYNTSNPFARPIILTLFHDTASDDFIFGNKNKIQHIEAYICHIQNE